ncbi:glycosyltransferase family 4 protein (plasmid) [Roseobacteraceae bacterium NS-SX3]
MDDAAFRADGQKVFFDISGLIGYIESIDRYSGIQRVVVELIAEFSRVLAPERMYLCWAERTTGRFRCLPFSEIGAEALVSPTAMRKVFHPGAASMSQLPMLDRYRNDPAKYYFHRTRLDVMSLLGHESSFRKRDMTARMWREARRAKAPEARRARRPGGKSLFDVAAPGDHLAVLDSSWQPHQISAFKKARAHGMEVHTLVYDLIPIVTPQYCAEMMPFTFYDWLLQSVEYTSRYMTISEATRQDLLRFFEAHSIDLPAVAVPLAQAGLDGSGQPGAAAQDTGPVSSVISTETYPFLADVRALADRLRHIAGGRYVLCVGTIEARKNVWRIAMAWKHLIDQGHTDLPKLVFAGRRGWLREEFEHLLEGTGHIYGYVRIVEGPSDEELHLLYKHCQFAIMASVYEGWGLPVGEALAYGKTAVVADNSSLPEVGGDLVEYCDAMSVKSIADAVLRLADPARRSELEEKIRTARLRSWADVARDMARAIGTAKHI